MARSGYIISTLLVLFTLEVDVSATEIVLEEYPVNYGIRAKPNILLSVDDSSSMDVELSVVGTLEGFGYWGGSPTSFVDSGGPRSSGGSRFTHLFPLGSGTSGASSEANLYNGGEKFGENYVPPYDVYGYMRSSNWNTAYYDPSVDYEPWPTYGGYGWPNIDPTKAWLDPSLIGSTQTSRLIDLTAEVPVNAFGTNGPASFDSLPGMWCDNVGTLCLLDTDFTGPYWAATYYVSDILSNFTYFDGVTTVGPISCADSKDLSTDFYQVFHDNRTTFTVNGSANFDGFAFAPDGSCLERVKIESTRNSYPSGRKYDDELQNFANWFTYYRKRHQVARGALGSSLQGIRGIRSGLYWINNRRTISMNDLDNDAELKTLLGENYYRVSSGSTYNLEALNHAGRQFDTNTNIIQYSCQRNYTLMFTDGYTSQNTGFSSVGNSDGNRGAPYADSASNTLADVADYYYTRSLRAGTADINGEAITTGRVPVPSACSEATPDPWLDCNADLHMNTYTVSFGLPGQDVFGQPYPNGMIAGVWDEVRDAYEVAPPWPTSIGFDGRAIDDLYHAAVNGRGEMYYAQRPQELKDKLQSALRDILATEGSSAGLTFNSATLNSDSLVFNTIFNTTNWTGDLIATKLDPGTGLPTGGTAWRAQEVLESQDWETRYIVSYNSVLGQSKVFEWANLTAHQQADLSTSPDGTTDTLGEQRLNYLRGDRTNEGTLFRERQALLGDMVSSTPAYVANTSVAWPDYTENDLFGGSGLGESHSYFRRTTVRDRDPMIYVGANDGMLHGFDATNGTGGGIERLAYIPSAVFSDKVREGLHFLTDPDYTHRFYVDAEPAYSDVFVNWGGVTKWRTVLTGGFRTGAKGFYALDVTDPDEFSDANVAKRVLLEYNEDSNSDGSIDSDLGYMFERPSIGMLNNGEWALIYGNGYNSRNGNGAIYVVFIEKVLANGWVEGTTYKKFLTNRTGAINGITTIDYGSNRVIDAVYASDAAGYMWKLDLTGSNENNWGYAASSGGNPVPLFDAVNDAGIRQPVITRPRVIKHPSVSDANNNAPNRLVIFGTGSMVEEADLSTTSVQSFYAVWDNGSVTTTALDRTDLVKTEATTTTNAAGFPQRDLTTTVTQSPWGGQNKGFYFDMPVTGERVLDYIDIRQSQQSPGDYYALFSSVIPDSDVCSYGGTSWIMAVDLRTGEAPTYAVFDTNQDGVIDGDDEAAGGVFSSDYLVDFVAVGGLGYGNTSTGDIVTFTIEEGEQSFTGRIGWQELIAR